MAEPLEYRDALLSRTLRAVALPLLFALVLLTALIAVVTERAFRPVRRIAADLAGRGADDLSAVNTAEMPVETHALGRGAQRAAGPARGGAGTRATLHGRCGA